MTADLAELVIEIDEPGVYQMPAEVYHADPVPTGSLSSTGARRLLPPSCPARFRWEQDHPREPTEAFDIGHAAHEMVLGGGPEIVRLDFPDRRTKAYKEAAAEARERDAVPLLPDDWQMVQDMADALRRHPIASALLDPTSGRSEQSLFWIDEPSGIWRRARFDWLRHKVAGKRLLICDYKTADSAERARFAKSASDHGYHQQDAWYTDAATALGLDPDPAFLFIVQEKSAPYLVNVIELDVTARRIGRYLNRQAIDTYAECVRTGTWPGYADDEVTPASLPPWYERKFEDQL